MMGRVKKPMASTSYAATAAASAAVAAAPTPVNFDAADLALRKALLIIQMLQRITQAIVYQLGKARTAEPPRSGGAGELGLPDLNETNIEVIASDFDSVIDTLPEQNIDTLNAMRTTLKGELEGVLGTVAGILDHDGVKFRELQPLRTPAAAAAGGGGEPSNYALYNTDALLGGQSPYDAGHNPAITASLYAPAPFSEGVTATSTATGGYPDALVGRITPPMGGGAKRKSRKSSKK